MADLVTLVSQVHAIATERGDEPIIKLTVELGNRLIAEAEPKEVMPEPPPTLGAAPAVSDEILALKAQLNEARLRLEQWVVNPEATKCPVCIARKASNADAQKRWRDKRVKKGKKTNAKSADGQKAVN